MNDYLEIFGDVLRLATFQPRHPSRQHLSGTPTESRPTRREARLPGDGSPRARPR
jgi:hypothetical protein